MHGCVVRWQVMPLDFVRGLVVRCQDVTVVSQRRNLERKDRIFYFLLFFFFVFFVFSGFYFFSRSVFLSNNTTRQEVSLFFFLSKLMTTKNMK